MPCTPGLVLLLIPGTRINAVYSAKAQSEDVRVFGYNAAAMMCMSQGPTCTSGYDACSSTYRHVVALYTRHFAHTPPATLAQEEKMA